MTRADPGFSAPPERETVKANPSMPAARVVARSRTLALRAVARSILAFGFLAGPTRNGRPLTSTVLEPKDTSTLLGEGQDALGTPVTAAFSAGLLSCGFA